MADDGLLVNFSLEDSITGSKPIFRGGRWKNRLIANKVAARKKLQAGPPATDASTKEKPTTPIKLPSTRPPKRQKLAETSLNVRPREIVSSLFSSNPTSKPPPNDKDKDSTETFPSAPSNAPLINSLHTFASLGLSPKLATHLSTKLSLRSPTAIQKSAISQLLAEDSDAFLQAETGSGKTLAYLLPIVQRIIDLSSPSEPSALSTAASNDEASSTVIPVPQKQVHRDSGLFAIVLGPTRELCKQIYTVLESVLRCAHWIVAGIVIGGEKKKSEKARLRKGLNILVATPGRLADHLNNTKVLDVSNVRWLVLDEGDRLMELGFEEEIKAIVKKLDEQKPVIGFRNLGNRAKLPEKRTTVMCSATMKVHVQRLGEISLKDAVHIKAQTQDCKEEDEKEESKKESGFLAPAQLRQSFIIVPTKQRLVTLTALLKHTFARRGSVMKVIVFLSCADSVDFHFEVFARESSFHQPPNQQSPSQNLSRVRQHSMEKLYHSNDETEKRPSSPPLPTVSPTPYLTSPQNPRLILYKLHGSLAQPLRTATLSAFSRSHEPCILLCTDVASRGLDLPNIDFVIEYDPPFSSYDHLHRVGRTARAGREGRAMIFLMPGAEERYVDVLKKGYRDGLGRGLVRNEAAETMKRGFNLPDAKVNDGGGSWEEKVTEWQLAVERWVIDDKSAGEMARRAFVSHVRAYATHIAKERGIFDVKGLHLGHLAKAFALRDRPGNMGRGAATGLGVGKASKRGGQGQNSNKRKMHEMTEGREARVRDTTDSHAPGSTSQDAGKRMMAKMKEHMAAAGEFNIG